MLSHITLFLHLTIMEIQVAMSKIPVPRAFLRVISTSVLNVL